MSVELPDIFDMLEGQPTPEQYWRKRADVAERKNAGLRRELRLTQVALEAKNEELDRLHKVWCTGGCTNGMHRYHDAPISEDFVIWVERYAKRIRSWWTNANGRIATGAYFADALVTKVVGDITDSQGEQS